MVGNRVGDFVGFVESSLVFFFHMLLKLTKVGRGVDGLRVNT